MSRGDNRRPSQLEVVTLRLDATLAPFAIAINMTLAEPHLETLLPADDVTAEVLCRRWE